MGSMDVEAFTRIQNFFRHKIVFFQSCRCYITWVYHHLMPTYLEWGLLSMVTMGLCLTSVRTDATHFVNQSISSN